MATTAIITSAVLVLVGALVWGISRLAHRQGVSKAQGEQDKAALDARRVRDDIEDDLRRLDDDAIDSRLRDKWSRD